MRVTRVQYDPDTMSCHVVLRLDDLAAILRTVNLKLFFLTLFLIFLSFLTNKRVHKVDHLQRAIQIAVP